MPTLTYQQRIEMGYFARMHKARRERLRCLGLCYYCGRRPASPGRVYCDDCRDGVNQKKRVRAAKRELT